MWWWWWACGPAPSGDCAADTEVEGTWAGEVTVGSDTFPLTFDLERAGRAVSGSATVGDDDRFDVSGSTEACRLLLTGRLTTPCGTTNGGGPKYCYDDWTFAGDVDVASLGGEAAVHTSNSEAEDDSSWTEGGTWWVQ